MTRMLIDDRIELTRAVELHQKGQWKEAEDIYRHVLSVMPGHSGAQQLLGALMVQNGQARDAIPMLEAVMASEPTNSACLGNLGTAYSRLKNYDAAINCYRRALAIDASNLDVARNLGSVLLKARRYDEAVPALEHALTLVPTSTTVQMHLAVALMKLGRDDAAIEKFEWVLEREPMHRQGLAGLGQLLMKKSDKSAEAEECWRKLIELEPQNPALFNNLGTTLKSLKRFEEAEEACRKALELRPDFFAALCNLGLVLSALGRFDESLKYLRQAVEVGTGQANAARELESPESAALDRAQWDEFGAVAYCQLAATTNMLGNQEEAKWAVEQALRIDPEDVENRMMRGFLHLQNGEFELGWPDYECRKRGKHAPRKLPGPEWDGSRQSDKTILIHAEQGLGDSIHFIRYALMVRERLGRIAFLCHKPLAKLMRLCPYLDAVIADGEALPEYDFQVPLLSLPAIFQTTFATVPRDVPYLQADAELEKRWRERLSGVQGLRVAIAWQGNREFANDQFRRVPLQQFKILADIPGVKLISVQKGDGTEQLADIDFEVLAFPEMDTVEGAFMDSAAIMKNVDLVISPCTATPHLAGALGVPVWLAKSFAAEWRWMADDREENPWYPTMRMFRQSTLGDWETVFEKMAWRLRNDERARKAP